MPGPPRDPTNGGNGNGNGGGNGGGNGNGGLAMGYDCAGVWGGNAQLDVCGVCGGDGSTCADNGDDGLSRESSDDSGDIGRTFNAFQSTVSSYSGFSTSKKVIDWSGFWSEVNIPVIGYDAMDDKLVVLKGADNSADSSKDILVYDFITGSWTRGDTKSYINQDMSNMITAPDTGELVILIQQILANTSLKRFKAHQPASTNAVSSGVSTTTVNITTPFFDFGSSGQKKRLYKVEVLARGTNLDDLAITAAYDGDGRASHAGYSNIFSSNTFSNTTALNWDKQTFTVSSPTDFNNISIRIYATGAMTTADWGISEITLFYREKGIR